MNRKTFDRGAAAGGEKFVRRRWRRDNKEPQNARAVLLCGEGNYPPPSPAPPLQPRDKNWSECAMVYGGSLKFLLLSEGK